jgi:predicted transcriptional regulator
MSNSRLYGKMLVIESAAAVAMDRGLSLADMLVLIRLVSFYNTNRGYAWPGKQKLSAELGITVRQVNRSINRLVDAGLLAVTRGGGRHSQTNQYVPAQATTKTPFEDAATRREQVTKQSPVQKLRTNGTDDRAVTQTLLFFLLSESFGLSIGTALKVQCSQCKSITVRSGVPSEGPEPSTEL